MLLWLVRDPSPFGLGVKPLAFDSINHPIPDWLIIHVRGPGNLVIHRGSERLVTLLNGRVEGHGFDLVNDLR